ncbi:UPF0489 family protein [Bacillus sp. DJP31]|uniref:UPF0489 family protein n=1 Tax=Bacillus sp. DJP31 TaxID=3409789 RepID=UPI003BB4E7C6
MGWRDDPSWKVVYPDQRIFLMREHNWALVAWEIALNKGWTEKNATLYQIDHHFDDAATGASVPGLIEATSVEELASLTSEVTVYDEKIGKDNYVLAGFARESIQKVVYVCPKHTSLKEKDPFDLDRWKDKDVHDILKAIPQERLERYTGKHFLSIEDLEKHITDEGSLPYANAKPMILSIDLDIFVEYEETSQLVLKKMKDEGTIRKQLQFLKSASDWGATVVAISPFYLGGDENAEFLVNLFLEEFNLSNVESQSWSHLF